MKIFSSFERTDVSHLADLFHRLEGSKEGGEEVGQDCEQVDDVHEASYELPPLVFEENLTKCNVILILVECLKERNIFSKCLLSPFQQNSVQNQHLLLVITNLSGQDMKRTRNSMVNQVMYIASRISIVSLESEIKIA